METDGEIDGSLAQQLGCLNTADKETLIAQFLAVLGAGVQIDRRAAVFFLDMNNWNVSSALCSYYDFGNTNNSGPSTSAPGVNQFMQNGSFYPNNVTPGPPTYVTSLPSMEFVRDITVGEGESVPPSTEFTKTWRVKNSGNESWPSGCTLRFLEGTNLCTNPGAPLPAPPLPPGEQCDISARMISPSEPKVYQSRWQLNTAQGVPFGDFDGINPPSFTSIFYDGSSDSHVPDEIPHLRQVDSTMAMRGSPPPVFNNHAPNNTQSSCSSSNNQQSTSEVASSAHNENSDDFDLPPSPNGSCAQYRDQYCFGERGAQPAMCSPATSQSSNTGPPAPPTTPRDNLDAAPGNVPDEEMQ